MNYTAVIQVRMTSTRLPGKVLMKIMDRPMLSYQIERIRHSQKIGRIVIATTTNLDDDPVVDLAEKEGCLVYRGSEPDVTDRYYQAAKRYGLVNIMRLTGDCPLVDPLICDRVITTYEMSGADFVVTGSTFAEGLDSEIFSFKCLEEVWHNTKLKSQREHPTLYIHDHPERFKKITLTNDTDDCRYRFTVDCLEDFQVVTAIFENLYDPDRHNLFTIEDIKHFLDSNPEIFRLNSKVIRNEGLMISLREDGEFAGEAL